jgi:hypothetical protein
MSKELSISPNKDANPTERFPSVDASDTHSAQTLQKPIQPPLRRPFVFLHSNFLEPSDEQLEKLKSDIKMKAKNFAEEQGPEVAKYVQPTVKHHPSGYYIGCKSNEDVKRLHEILQAQPLFGKEVSFRLVLDSSTPKVCQAVQSQTNG